MKTYLSRWVVVFNVITELTESTNLVSVVVVIVNLTVFSLVTSLLFLACQEVIPVVSNISTIWLVSVVWTLIVVHEDHC